jgi:threonine dehydrogenase-like Zn-dependent dehydrogenase
MQAAVIGAPREAHLEEVPVPAPAAGEVRVRVEGCGVCASNLGPWMGLPWSTYPMPAGEGGHDGWGTVDTLGEGVRDVRPGQRVAFLSNRAYAGYDVAAATSLVPLPAALDGIPFPGESFGCGMNIFRRSRIEAGQTVAIVGTGFLGQILVRLASRAGARVVAISRRDSALDLARELGAAETIRMDDHWRILEEVRCLTDGRGCARVIEAVGLQWPLDLAGELCAERGTLVIAGYHQDGPRQVNMQMWNWKGLDVVNAHERDPEVYLDGVRAAVDAVVSGVLDPRRLVTHMFPLASLGEALDATAGKPDGFLKAWVKP